MGLPQVPNLNLNYDDFYKFVTSFCIITFIFGILGTTILIRYYTKDSFIPIILYFLIAVISVVFFIRAILKWKTNQERLDKRLKLQLAKEILKYEKEIIELAKHEKLTIKDYKIIADALLLPEDYQKMKVRDRINKQI